MLKIIFALLLAFIIGAACRYFDIPVPAPPKLLGATLVLALTFGYIGTDWFLARQQGAPASQAERSGGPTGERPSTRP